MQAIVYKIVHGLKEDEEKREIEFYRGAGLPLPEGRTFCLLSLAF
jgi:hypothetical protein